MQRKSQILVLLATMLGVVVLGVAPVLAEKGDSSDDTSTSSTQEDQTFEAEDSSNDSSEVETEVETFRTDAKDRLATLREHAQEHSLAMRQKACEMRQTSINRRVSNFSTAAQRHLDVFTSIYTKVQAFYDDKHLNVADYDTLVNTVNGKQAAAQQAVAALRAVSINIDCTTPDPAQQVETLRTAVESARKALQAYRTSIKDLIVAIQGASSAQEDSIGGDQ